MGNWHSDALDQIRGIGVEDDLGFYVSIPGTRQTFACVLYILGCRGLRTLHIDSIVI